MCGRYSYFGPLDILKERITFTIHDTEPSASYNIAPTQSVPVLLKNNSQTVLKHLHWGLIPFWAKDPSLGARMINVRAETLSEKPSFKSAFKKRRCLILSNGYYEWTGEKGNKQPYFITLESVGPFAFAGLWETWQDKKNPAAPQLESCTIITTQAATNISHLHHRMPLILNSQLYEAWLDPELEDMDKCNQLLSDGFVHDFRYYPVSKNVNSARNNEPSLIKAI